MKKFNRILLVIICIVFISIIGYEYKLSYNFRTQPPSKEWSKGNLISKGNVKNYTQLVKVGENYVAAHDDGDKIKVMIVSSMGKVIKQKIFPAGDSLILDLNMLNDDKYVYVNWITINSGKKYLNNIKLNKDIELQDKWIIEGVNESAKLDNVTMALMFKDKIEILNIKDNTKTDKDVFNPTLLAGSKTNRGYMIAYWEDQQAFKYYFVKDGITTPIMKAADVTISRNVTFTKNTVECDDKTGYMIIEARTTDEYGIPKFITFDLDKGNGMMNRLKIDYYGEYAYSPVGVSSENEGAKFLITCQRSYGLRDVQDDIVELTFKDGKVSNRIYLTNKGNSMMHPGICTKAVTYCEYENDNNFNVYMASTDTAFKTMHNGVKGYEKFKAVSDMILGIANTLLGVFTVGIRWIVLAAILLSLLGLFAYKLRGKAADVVFIILYLIIAVVKQMVIYDMIYKEPIYNLPFFYTTSTAGMILCAGVSILCFIYGYTRYLVNKGTGSYPHVLSLVISLSIDSIMTQLLFIPFMQ